MKRLLFVFLIITCSSSYAEWRVTAVSNNGNYISYHDESTIRRNGAIVKLWTMRDYPVIQTDKTGDSFQSEKTLVAYDCRSETSATISIVQFSEKMGRGIVVFSGNRKENELDWHPNVPDSIGEIQWKIACGRK